jgi:phosphatidylinositol 3-kinase
MLYLLQLVQALRFESMSAEQRSSRSASSSAISLDDSGLADFLIERAAKNHVLGNRFHWYLMVEVQADDKVSAKMYGRVDYKFQQRISEVRI